MKKEGVNPKSSVPGPNNSVIVNESISVKGSKNRFQQKAAEAVVVKASPKKDFQDEIIRARAGREMPVTPPAVNNGPAAVNAQEDAAARQARKAAYEARFAAPGQKKVVKTTEKDAVFASLKSPEYRARFATNKSNIVKFTQEGAKKMHQDARSRVQQLLNIERSVMPEARAQAMQNVPGAVAKKAPSPMQLIGMSNMFVEANSQSMVAVPGAVASKSAVMPGAVAKSPLKYSESVGLVDEPELAQVAFRQILDFNFLHDARIVAVPEGNTIDEDNIKEKLHEFMDIVFRINEDMFLDFLREFAAYDRKLDEYKAASAYDKPRLKAEFDRITAAFRQRFDAVIVSLVEAVSNMSVLVAYLENNPEAGVNVHRELRAQYETQGHDVMIQMQTVLIEKCSKNVCAILGLRNDDNEGIGEKIKSTLLNQACALNDEGRINKFLM